MYVFSIGGFIWSCEYVNLYSDDDLRHGLGTGKTRPVIREDPSRQRTPQFSKQNEKSGRERREGLYTKTERPKGQSVTELLGLGPILFSHESEYMYLRNVSIYTQNYRVSQSRRPQASTVAVTKTSKHTSGIQKQEMSVSCSGKLFEYECVCVWGGR
jgi:hypothetical protein